MKIPANLMCCALGLSALTLSACSTLGGTEKRTLEVNPVFDTLVFQWERVSQCRLPIDIREQVAEIVCVTWNGDREASIIKAPLEVLLSRGWTLADNFFYDRQLPAGTDARTAYRLIQNTTEEFESCRQSVVMYQDSQPAIPTLVLIRYKEACIVVEP